MLTHFPPLQPLEKVIITKFHPNIPLFYSFTIKSVIPHPHGAYDLTFNEIPGCYPETLFERENTYPMPRILSNNLLSIDQQLFLLDKENEKFLLLYARPTVRGTYWLVLLHNAKFPRKELHLASPNSLHKTIIALREFAFIFNADSFVISEFAEETNNSPLITKSYKTHNLSVVHKEVDNNYQIVLINEINKKEFILHKNVKTLPLAQQLAKQEKEYYESH